MGTRTEHAPGTFSWVDLTTSDAAGAKEFYGALLGWDFEDNEIPGGGTYTMCKVGGEYVAAIPDSTDDHPPHWNSYVTVAGADETAAKADQLGGEMIEQPFDVMEAGRMALLADPTGATLCVWEPGKSIGAGRVNDPGCLTWNELHTPDPGRTLEFYTGLFGWNTEAMDTQGGPSYTIVKVGERSNGGIMDTQEGEPPPSYTIVKVGERSNGGIMDAQEGEPPNWLPYFAVEDRDQAAEKATGLGARELFRMEMPQGRIAVFSDPQGAPFAVWEGETDD